MWPICNAHLRGTPPGHRSPSDSGAPGPTSHWTGSPQCPVGEEGVSSGQRTQGKRQGKKGKKHDREGRKEGQEDRLQGEAWWGEAGTGSGGAMPRATTRSSSPPSPRAASLTTLSSGTERLSVHSWLFTKESAGEKATCQGGGGIHTYAICHQLSPTLPLPRPRPGTLLSRWDPNPHHRSVPRERQESGTD